MLSKNLSYVKILLGVILTLTMILSACQPAPTPAAVVTEPPVKEEPTEAAPAATEAPEEPAAKYSEAPILKELVDKGELPPVEERLPVNPLVIPVTESTRTVRRSLAPRFLRTI
jgi:peptide/nickel transport system substrate-binding protein